MKLIALLFFSIGAVAAQAPRIEAYVQADDFAESMLEGDELFAGCSLACAYAWTTTASSYLPAQGQNQYGEAQLEDNRARTAWVEGVDGDGVGEWLLFTLEGDSEQVGNPVPMWGIDIVNGYVKNQNTWSANGRVREMMLYLNGEEVSPILLVDTYLPQSVDLGLLNLHVQPGDQIKLEILSVYPGSRFADTAISEIVLHGAH